MHSPHSICKSKSKAGVAEAVLPKYNLLFSSPTVHKSPWPACCLARQGEPSQLIRIVSNLHHMKSQMDFSFSKSGNVSIQLLDPQFLLLLKLSFFLDLTVPQGPQVVSRSTQCVVGARKTRL